MKFSDKENLNLKKINGLIIIINIIATRRKGWNMCLNVTILKQQLITATTKQSKMDSLTK